ncbi:hypothetical protein TWF730_005024 [Orbilia blumenaviensis]|uniref:Uncharacterized protein n=1 Tax=Orbilia blumenaviensis TaxID=1796055 RepID=A0AAV9VJB6_9PEZI
MASDTSDGPVRHHPHADDEPTGYGSHIEVVPDPNGGPPTVYRERPTTLNWDNLSETARNMFAEMATGDVPNRFETCVHMSLLKWAEQMKPGDPNRLPDGNPTYIQDDFIPIIKAYVNRIPYPGVAGTPIPPALPMIELEALDFLHHHQALPYQQADYADIFGDLPDGFVWHPIQTLVGVRGLDHRTLIEFRAYKHFWTIHKNDPQLKEYSTKDEPTSEVSIIRPGGDPDYPQITPGGFHNMSLPPTNQQLKKEFAKVNKKRKAKGQPEYAKIMYVRFANNLARIMTDYSNDASVFDEDGVPHTRIVGSVQYEEYMDEDEFMSRFPELGRVYVNRLPTIFETTGSSSIQLAEETPVPAGTSSKPPVESGNKKPEFDPNVIEFTAEFAGVGVEAKINIPSCECPAAIKAAQMTNSIVSEIASMKKTLGTGPQRVHIPEVDCCSKTAMRASAAANNLASGIPTKTQLDLADLSAIETKIRQLSMEKKNPRQLKSLSKNPGSSYTIDTKLVTSKPYTAKSTAKASGNVKCSATAVSILTTTSASPGTLLPELKAMTLAPGYFFANCLNRQKLVEDLMSEKFSSEIPLVGPGAKSWSTIKSEQRANPINTRFVDTPSIEHIKYLTVVGIQQTVFYYLYISERIKRKKVPADSADGTCFLKVYNILDAGQRLVIEHDIENYYVRTNGVARVYDHSISSGLIATPIEPISTKYELTAAEQVAYRTLMAESKDLWRHPTTCKCRTGRN